MPTSESAIMSHHKKIYLASILWITTFSLVLFGFLFAKDYLRCFRDRSSYQATALDSMSNRLDAIASDIESSYREIGQELALLPVLAKNGSDRRAVFEEFASRDTTYRGFDVVDRSQATQYEKTHGDTGHTDFFGSIPELFTLKQNEIFLSDVGRDASGSSIVYAAVPVVPERSSSSAPAKQIIIAEINLDYLIAEVKRDARPDESIMLINKDGSCLSCVDDDTGEYQLLSSTVKRAIMDENKGTVIDGGKAYSFRKIYPELAGNELWRGFNVLNGSRSDSSQNYWVLISAASTTELFAGISAMNNDLLITTIFSALIVLTILLALYFARYSKRVMERDRSVKEESLP